MYRTFDRGNCIIGYFPVSRRNENSCSVDWGRKAVECRLKFWWLKRIWRFAKRFTITRFDQNDQQEDTPKHFRFQTMMRWSERLHSTANRIKNLEVTICYYEESSSEREFLVPYGNLSPCSRRSTLDWWIGNWCNSPFHQSNVHDDKVKRFSPSCKL